MPAAREAHRVRIRAIAFVLTAAGAVAVLGYGIFRGEMGEVMFNAAML